MLTSISLFLSWEKMLRETSVPANYNKAGLLSEGTTRNSLRRSRVPKAGSNPSEGAAPSHKRM